MSICYAELQCLSNFTFLHGASHPEELVNRAFELGYEGLCLADECSLAGVVRAHVAARANGLQLLIGSQFHTLDGYHFLTIAPDRLAYGELASLITLARRRSTKGQYALSLNDLEQGFSSCLCIWFPSPSQCRQSVATLQAWLKLFPGRLWIGIQYHWQGKQAQWMLARSTLAQQLALPLVACGDAWMHSPERKPLQDVLTAIRLNTQVQTAGFNLESNAERHLQPLEVLSRRHVRAHLDETIHIARRCHFNLDQLRYEYPQELVPKGWTASRYLAHLVMQGAGKRWPQGTRPDVQTQLEYELALIQELQYNYYFLTVYDIVQFARSQGILCQGRGSAANSAVCFCLFITEVDPEHSHLLFERFISRERNEPPDIDVDFEHERREEVIQYIYRHYGRQRAALVATVITYRLKSALRDVGKALGFDLTLIEQCSQSLAWWDRSGQLPARLQELGVNTDSQVIVQYQSLVKTLLRFPRHLSQHVGGFIISAGPLDRLIPIENAAMPDRTIVQWDKDDIEALGLLKIDVLALGMLSAIRKCFTLIEQLRGQAWSMASIPAHDPQTYQMLQQGDSMGVFQVESRAQMTMLPRLKPACFYDLVIEVAIVRPGPIQGNMVHPYLKRRSGQEAVTYPNEAVKEVLERTLGVPIFQEQVIRLAMVAAGFSAGEADQLRRAMASWRKKGQLRHYQEKLAAGLLQRGHSLEFANQLIEQINGFGEYGFPESHAASFALLVYVSAWLKRHEPAAFCCALLNSQPMGFYSPSQLIQDVRRRGIAVYPVDVTCSDWDHTLESPLSTSSSPTIDTSSGMADKAPHSIPEPQDGTSLPQPAIRLGLRLVQGLGMVTATRLLQARQASAFASVADLQSRARLNRRELAALAQADALCSLAGHRFQARWAVQALKPPTPLLQQTHLREIPVTLDAPTSGEALVEDYRSLGLTLGAHPLALLRRHPTLSGCKTHQALSVLPHRKFVRTAGLVTCRQRPGTASGAVFLTLEDETGNSNVIIWRDLLERRRAIVLQARLLMVKGVVERGDGNVVHVIAGELEDLSALLGTLPTESRDFH
jgi:error-prone DNA polymerase